MINNKGVEEYPLLDKLVENAVFPEGTKFDHQKCIDHDTFRPIRGMRQEKTEAEKLADQHSAAIMELVKRIEVLESQVIGKEG